MISIKETTSNQQYNKKIIQYINNYFYEYKNK